jgi:hypothetical protein
LRGYKKSGVSLYTDQSLHTQMGEDYIKVKPRIYANKENTADEKSYVTYKTKRPQIPVSTRDAVYAVVRARCDDVDHLSFAEAVDYLCDVIEAKA